MHDPMTVAFEIRYPWKKYGRRGRTEFEQSYRASFVTIWHRDPERDGSDDSCGWFKRARHGNPAGLAQVRQEYEFEWDAEHGGWFTAEGMPKHSVHATALNMVWRAAWVHFGKSRDKTQRFMQRHLFDVLFFAENPVDSLHPLITNKYDTKRREDRIDQAASIIYAWVIRQDQKWWQHPRWHLPHWRIQVHPWQQLRRRFWDKCCKCGRRGFPSDESAMGDWSGERIWHASCDDAATAQVHKAA